MSDVRKLLTEAYEKNDASVLVEVDREKLERLKIAEEILEARFQAKKRANRIATLSTMLVGWVALGGFFANAYQNHTNKLHLQEQAERDQVKWQQEFDRARAADKYRAFFETSALVTDPSNADRRLIGYSLLEEFVADPGYHQKATAILEESLTRELGDVTIDTAHAVTHQNAVRQIVVSLSATQTCEELVPAARSIDRLLRYARDDDTDESRKVLSMYVRRVVGHGALACHSYEDWRSVREPIATAVNKMTWVVNLPAPPGEAELNRVLMATLLDACADEEAETANSECPDIRKRLGVLCGEARADPKLWAGESAACALLQPGAGQPR